MTSIPLNNITIEIDSIQKHKENIKQEIKQYSNSLSIQAFSKMNDLYKKSHTKKSNVQINKTPKKIITLYSKSKTNDNSEIISNKDCDDESNSLKNNYKRKSLNNTKSNNHIQKIKNNRLIESKIHEGLNKIKSNIIINNEKSNINYNIIKKRKICNKFQVYQIKPKIRKERRSIEHRYKRKYNSDDIRKKIKLRFHKSIKNIINENLRKAGSKLFFSFLPQIFISSIGREKNNEILNLTYREIIEKDFLSDIDGNKLKNRKSDLNKYKNNLKVLEYLDKNTEISKNSGFDIISNMKYSKLLDEYFKSEEFEKSILKLKEENEEEEYIREYIKKAKNYISFFSNIPK